MGDLYVRPTALAYGPDAGEAIRQGAGLPLAGNPDIAWTAGLVSEDRGTGWRLRKVQALKASQDGDVSGWVERLTSARAQVAGLSMTEPQIMGIVNTTPDSFSDGGVNAEADVAIANARDMARQGASLLDVGGESTRPGSDPVSEAEEWRRIEPVITALVGDGLKVSCDTRKAAIMTRAAKAGAVMINDVAALSWEAAALPAAVATGLPVCLMHAQGDPKTMQNDPRYDNVLVEVFDWLAARIEDVVSAGVPRAAIVADPGIGFGKTFQHNLELLQGLTLFHGLGVPVLLGASRKGFIGAVTGEKVAGNRQVGSAVAAVHGIMAGMQIIRVHDVRETLHAVSMWRAAAGIAPLTR